MMPTDRDPRARALFWRWVAVIVAVALVIGLWLLNDRARGTDAPAIELRSSELCPGDHCPVRIRLVEPEIIAALVRQHEAVGNHDTAAAVSIWSGTACDVFMPALDAYRGDWLALLRHEVRHCREGQWHG